MKISMPKNKVRGLPTVHLTEQKVHESVINFAPRAKNCQFRPNNGQLDDGN